MSEGCRGRRVRDAGRRTSEREEGVDGKEMGGGEEGRINEVEEKVQMERGGKKRIKQNSNSNYKYSFNSHDLIITIGIVIKIIIIISITIIIKKNILIIFISLTYL
jgi:hypothetical protein